MSMEETTAEQPQVKSKFSVAGLIGTVLVAGVAFALGWAVHTIQMQREVNAEK